MHYQISRNGQDYGPYTLEDIHRYVASGNILLEDLVKSEEMPDWIPVAQLLGQRNEGSPMADATTPPEINQPAWTTNAGFGSDAAGMPPGGYVPPAAGFAGGMTAGPQGVAPLQAAALSAYPDAPNLHWALVLVFAVLTCSFFMPVWNIVVAAWLKRVQPNANSLYLYIAAAVMTVFLFGSGVMTGAHLGMGNTTNLNVGPGMIAIFGIGRLVWWVLRLIARFSQRGSLEEHFNGPEPIGLRLSPVMTFFFGGLYFQYHLNRINALKQMARYGSGRAY